jgi:O-antigen/teichoic acid export membrane protein
VYHYFLPVGLTLLCFMVLTNSDLILVKHFFTPMEAGHYSIAQMVGKIILFFPVPVVMVMFPRISSLAGQERKALSTLGQSLMITGFLCALAAGFSLVYPSYIIRFLSGNEYSECIPLARIFSVNMALFSLTLILLYYQLATLRKWFLLPLSFLTFAQILLITLFHKTLTQVLSVVSIVSVCLVAVNLCLAYLPHRRSSKDE